MNNPPLVYLGGPIAGLTYEEAAGRRNTLAWALKELGIGVLSPMRGKGYLKDAGILQPSGYAETPLSGDRAIVTRDRFDIQNCDMVLMDLTGATRVSIGSMVEFGWANAYGKPIVTLIETDNVHQHAFVKELSNFMVADVLTALQILKAHLVFD